MDKKTKMYERIKKHGEDLKRIFNVEDEPVKLCKKLRTIERCAHSIAEQYCNGDIDHKEYEEQETKIMNHLYCVLNNGNYNEDRPHHRGVPVFLNGDARGYALKINDSYMDMLNKSGITLYEDWGGYGIIAPDLSE